MLGSGFTLSVVLSFASSEALENVNEAAACLILLGFILLGIVFDIVGVAATSAVEKPFHSMAARRVPGSTESVWIIRNAEKVSSFCNDVVGDICGIISGTTSAVIIVKLGSDLPETAVQLLITGLIAGLTIGGKAFGKTIAISKSNDIVFAVGRLAHTFAKLFKRR